MKTMQTCSWLTVLIWIGSMAKIAIAADLKTVQRVTGDAVVIPSEQKAIVLLAVRWDRHWKCGGFENAQLRVIGFDKLPSDKLSDEDDQDLILDDAPRVLTKPIFENYAFLVEPGEYGLSRLEIKVARSVSDIGIFKVPRSKFLADGKSLGGSFSVAAGEVVYIGHFYLDCKQQPTMWRYYPDGRDGFDAYLGSLKKAYPVLDTRKVLFRLFQTKEFGHDYALP